MIAATLDLNTPATCEAPNCDRPATRVYNAGALFGYESPFATLELCDRDGHIYEWRLDKSRAR